MYSNKLLILLLLTMIIACKKNFDHPPYTVLGEGQKINISQAKSRVPLMPAVYRFAGGDTCLYCTVTADENTGSFYEQVFVRDDEGSAIQVNLVGTGGLYTGDRLRINLNGVTVTHANGLYTLDSVNTGQNTVKISSGNKVIPHVVSLSQVLSGVSGNSDLQSQLVELNGVEFVYRDRGVQLGEPIGKSRKDLTLTDCNSNTITVTTSGFANFAAKPTPEGNGKLIGIVTRYNNDVRLELRGFDDLQMHGPACTSSAASTGTFVLSEPVAQVHENFDMVNNQGDYASEQWINYTETGKAKWKGNIKSGIYKTVRATAYGSSEKTTTWLISPPVVFTKSLKLSFKTGIEYYKTGHLEPIMAYVCTNFDGSNFATANWTPLNEAVYAGSTDGNYTGPGGLRFSGEITLKDLPLLASYTGNFFVAFRYSGEPGFETNVYLDEVLIQ